MSVDAVLLLSFGGPEGPDDVLPFLENVTRGRDVPRERLEEVAEQYLRFGGRSPINDQCRALIAALRAQLAEWGHELPIYWGNRNWAPYVEDTMAEMAAAGHQRVVALTTSAYSSYSACRQYLEDIERARAAVGESAPEVVKVRPYWNNPGFVLAQGDRLRTVLDGLDRVERAMGRIVFTAHSLPMSMAESSDYEVQLRDAASLVLGQLEEDWRDRWDLVFQSRSGPPQVPWLGPDIGDHLRTMHEERPDVASVIVVPIGFTSDHQEVVFDLDTQAAEIAAGLGLRFHRVPTVGTHPAFILGLGVLLEEYIGGTEPVALGPLGPRRSPCAADCCPPPARRPSR